MPSDPCDEKSLPLSTIAYNRLHREILTGDLAPDQPLRLEALRQRYGLSFSPLREALSRLRAEGLVESSGKSGFRVARFSLSEMWDAINTRTMIDSEVLRRSIVAGDSRWEADIVSCFHELDANRREISRTGNLVDQALRDQLETVHSAFHRALLAACPSRLLLQLSDMLYAQTERYRRPILTISSPETAGDGGPDDEHRAMMAAALARDSDRAAEVMRIHLEGTGRFIENAHHTSRPAIQSAAAY